MSQQALHGQYAPEEQYSEPGLVANFTSWIGALTSLGLVAGLGVWGYQLTLRDVTDVPVIRAMTGAARVLPDDPGGETAAHQGLAVNRVQTGSGIEGAADRVVLAPDPVRLSDEDIASINLRPVKRDQKLASLPKKVTDVSAVTDSTADKIEALVLQAVNQTSRDEKVRNLARLPGVKRSPRPRARAVVASLATPPELVAATGHNVDVDPSEILTGTRLVQLGAFDDVATAKREWDTIIERHGDLIGARKRFIQEAESGGRKFYRLRMVGFENLSDSRRLCSALLARGTPCIPVTAR
jgi:sporulation related protein